MTGEPAPLSAQISDLMSCGPLKTWSVLVTVLGDLCTAPQDRIEGRVLTALMARMGINSQAVRVALHRLRRDGWIESTKTGRSACYSLTSAGWSETQAVRPQIYSTAAAPRRNVWLAVAPPGIPPSETDGVFPRDSVMIAPRTALTLVSPTENPARLLLSPLEVKSIPKWAAEIVICEKTLFEYKALTDSVCRILNQRPPAELGQKTVLRMLILHQWRRLRLRHGDLPDAVLASDWPGARARDAVASALKTFARPSLQQVRDSCQTMA